MKRTRTMNLAARILNVSVLLLASVSSAFAASGAREDNSGVFVWIFLAFCALIIIAQLLPAVLMMFGMAKGLTKAPETAKETATMK